MQSVSPVYFLAMGLRQATANRLNPAYLVSSYLSNYLKEGFAYSINSSTCSIMNPHKLVWMNQPIKACQILRG